MKKPKLKRPKSKNPLPRKLKQELQEIELLESWIEFGKPDSGSNPLSIKPLPSNSPIGRINENLFSPYVACEKFNQLPLSKYTKDGLTKSMFRVMTEIQKASLPHSLCGRDIFGAAKTGSGKTRAFIIPVKFVFKAFKKLRPGIPLKCLHGWMKQERRMGIYSQFCEERSVLFTTDVGSRGLDFIKAVDWVVQVDCPDDVTTYIHRISFI